MAKEPKEIKAKVVADDKQVVLAKPRGVPTRARPAGTVSVNPEKLLLAAVRGKVAPESLKAIMDMRRELVEEQSKREYYDALGRFQEELEPIIKTKVVRNSKEYLEKHPEAEADRFRYAPIEAIAKKIQTGCKRHGFSYSFDSGELKEGKMDVFCDIHHVGGYQTRHRFPSPVFFEDGKAIGQSKAQTINGAITFGRRVSLIEGFGIMSADPDPETTEGKNAKKAEGVATEPRSTEEAETSKKGPSGTKETLDAVFEDVTKLIEQKCSGKAQAAFVAQAHKHYDADRKDLLVAMRTSLKLMRQGVAK